MQRVNFDKGWSRPHKFTAGKNNPNIIHKWSCQGKSGIYAISDEDDQEILYVGKGDAIHTRLMDHMEGRGAGNSRIAEDVAIGKTFTIRWILSRDPELSESIAIVILTPRYNGRCEWKRGVDKVNLLTCIYEAERLGLIESKDKVEENLVVNICNALEIRIAEARRKKKELCIKAESISNSTDWKEAEEAIKGLQKEWKTIGFTGKDFEDITWFRFKNAIDLFYKRCTADAQQRKKELCIKAEALNKSTNWKEAEEAIKGLQKEWKTIGFAGKDFEDAIWFRFKNAIDTFYERRKAYFAQRESEQEENRRKKEQICREVESLSNSTEWKKTSDAFKDLMERWKKIGSAKREDEDKLWQRFKAAQQKFYDQRNAYFYRQEQEQRANLDRKLRLCIEAESLSDIGAKLAGDVRDSVRRVKELQAEWKTIGFVPKEQQEEVQKRFYRACDLVFQWDRQEKERKQYEWREKMKEIIANKNEQINRLMDSIRHDEQIIEQKRDKIYGLRPGGRASEIREHLENQIQDIKNKIESKREKIREIHSSIRDLEIKVYGF